MDTANHLIGVDVGLWVAFHGRWAVYDNDFGLARSPEVTDLNDLGRERILKHFGLKQYADQLPIELLSRMSPDELANWRPEALH